MRNILVEARSSAPLAQPLLASEHPLLLRIANRAGLLLLSATALMSPALAQIELDCGADPHQLEVDTAAGTYLIFTKNSPQECC